MRRFFSYLRPSSGLVVLTLLFKITATLLELAIPFVLQHILNTVAPGNSLPEVLIWGGIMLLCAAAAWGGNIVGNRLASRVARNQRKNIKRNFDIF